MMRSLAEAVKEVVEAAELLKKFGLTPPEAVDLAIKVGTTALMVKPGEQADEAFPEIMKTLKRALLTERVLLASYPAEANSIKARVKALMPEAKLAQLRGRTVVALPEDYELPVVDPEAT